MTDNVTIAIIGSVATTVVGLFNAYVILKTHTQSKANGHGINIVKEQTNGLQQKLMAAEKGLSYQEGMAGQRKEDKGNPS